jgi:hypothetical protein
LTKATLAKDYNKGIINVQGLWEPDPQYAYPTRPAAYTGISFANTGSKGGYGDLSSGMYDILQTGFKPFGSIG